MTSATQARSNDWCEERLQRPGEALHLARLFSPTSARAEVTAIAALYIELEAIAGGQNAQRDLNVARMKLGWWREELGRLETGEATHPATQLLAPTDVSLSLPHLLDLITGMELNLLEGRPHDLASACVVSERCGPRLVAALNVHRQAGAQDGAQGSAAPNVIRLGRGLALARLLRQSADEAIRAEVASAARQELEHSREQLATSVAAIRVLAALAWDRTRRPEAADAIGTGSQRLQTVRAWRAARGKLPRGLRAQ